MSKFILIISWLITHSLIYITHLNLLHRLPSLLVVTVPIAIGLHFVSFRFFISKIIG